ncbi:MAG: S9 family peptidase, partial [Bacteroidaceae bacterium]|nr:S9 family peptidase [Bacteroidaceae bacterium]
MKLTKLLINALLLCFALSPCFAQSNDVDEITGRAKKKRVLGPITWLKDGEGYSTLEWNSKVGANDVVRYEAKDDARSILIPAEKFIDKATGKPIGVSSFQWSEDNSKILI